MVIPKKYLTENVILIESIVQPDDILKILMQDRSIKMNSTSDDQNFQYYKKLVDNARSGYKQGKKGAKSEIILDNFKLSKRAEAERLGLQKRYTSLGSVLTVLKQLMDTKGQYNPKNEASNIIQITTLELLCGYLKVPVPKRDPKPDPDPDPTPDPDPRLKAGIDWTAEKAKRLANTGGKPASEVLDKFYADYYSIEYAGEAATDSDKKAIVDKLNSLNKLLTQEFNKLGYNPTVNPFAQFLKLLIKYKKDIFDKLTLNNYGAIHNAFIEKYITGNKLGNYNNKNLLFCSDLYNYKGLDMVKYLSLYKQTIDKAKDDSQYADDPELLVAKVFIQQKQIIEDNYAENLKELLKLNENDIILPDKADAKLRSQLEISEMYHHLFKDTVKQKIDKSTADKIREDAEKAGISKEMFKYILDIDVLPNRDKTKYEEWFSQLGYTTNKDNTIKVKQMLSGYLIHEASSASNLIDSLYRGFKAAGKRESPYNEAEKDEKKT